MPDLILIDGGRGQLNAASERPGGAGGRRDTGGRVSRRGRRSCTWQHRPDPLTACLDVIRV